MWLAILVALFLLFGRRIANPPESENSIALIADAIAHAEGFFAGDTLPRRRNNPGSITRDGELIQYPTEQDGWNALYRQIESILYGWSSYYSPGMTISEVARVYTGGDKPEAWANIVASRLGVSVTEIWTNLPSLLEATA